MKDLSLSRNLRVAVVGPYPVDPARPVGGIHSVVYNLVHSLKDRVEFHIVTVNHDPDERIVEEEGIRLHCRTFSKKAGQFLLYRPERKWIRHEIASIRPDLVHVHGTDMYGVAGMDGVHPAVLTVHGILFKEAKIQDPNLSPVSRLQYRAKWWFNARFEKKTLRRARDIIVISPYVADAIRHLTSARFHYIDNPVHPGFFAIEDQTISGRVLFVGMIRARKGLLHLVKAVHLAAKQVPQIHLHVVGKVFEPDYMQLISDFIEQQGLKDRIIFRGRVSEEELYREFAECSLLCLPSVEESSPMVVEQAMAAGKPVVASRVGGIPYLVEDGKSGYLVDYADEKGLANALMKICSDPDTQKRMGQRGREIACQRFDPARIAEKTLEVYRKVASRGV
jgi:glycosyltransferase involved in cell wall biosynthesis